MKRNLLLIIFWIASLPMFAQMAVSVSGYITNSNGNVWAVNQPVTISIDSLAGPATYTTVYTNSNGYYSANIPLYGTVLTGTLYVMTTDCQNYTWSYPHTFSPDSMAFLQYFYICQNTSACFADYNFFFQGGLSLQFMNTSIGGNGINNWYFGDGYSSNQTNPSHTFPAPGLYNVSLTIGYQGSGCYDTKTQSIWVVDSTSSGCQSQFSYALGSNGSTAYFSDMSVYSSPVTWFWSFGDGTYSNEESPIHTYPPNMPPMSYTACLTISSSDSSCNSTSCQEVSIGQTGSCQAYFEAQTVPGTYNTLQYTDYSTGQVQTWVYDFGDGQVVNINYPQSPNITHTYASPGMYNTCLSTTTVDSCFSSYCQYVYAGDTIAGCQAYFQAYVDSAAVGLIHFQDLSQGNPVAWSWNFGDPASGANNTSTLQYPSHQFMVNGPYNVYTVCLTITGANGCTDTYCSTITVTGSSTCQAYFTHVTTSWIPPYDVQFFDGSVTTGPVQWFWDFGDGTSSNLQNPSHTFPTYPSFATYTVCLTISDSSNSCSSTYCDAITVGTQSCVAYFEEYPGPNPNPGTTNLSVYFDDMSTGNIQTWTWNFDDGTSQVVNYPDNPDVLHTYTEPGYYYVTLGITGDSCSSFYARTIMVMDSVPSCQAQFSWHSITTSNNTIAFVDLSSGYPSQYYWNFGDGNYSTEVNPMHSFDNPGTYTVCLTINGTNCQSTWCSQVEVGENEGCINYFTFNNLGLSVNFTGHTVDSTGLSTTYLWEFGDNSTSTGQNVIHTYNAPGVYNVYLTTVQTDSSGYDCYATSFQMVNVGDTVLWNQVYGQIFAGNFPLSLGIAMLISVDTLGTFFPYTNVAAIDSMGMFYFPMVPQGSYLLYAIPFIYGYLPTYFGNALYWQDATVLNLGTAMNPYYINLIDASTVGSGSGSIQGQISGGDIATSLIDKVTMLLKDENGNVVLFKQVDASGSFEFPALPYGTYYLYAELAGCTSQAIKVVIDEANPTAQVNLNMNGGTIQGRNDGILTLDAGVVYPNPVKDVARINLTLSSASEIKICIYNLSGQLLIDRQENLGAGLSSVNIPVEQLAGGVYTLRITTPDGLLLSRKLVK